MSIEDDPPAAHSMDTTWFAIDADGVVARFDSGEAGAVPNDAALGGGAGEPSFDVDLLYQWLIARRLAREIPAPDPEPIHHDDRIVVALAPETDDPATYRDGTAQRHPAERLLAPFDPIVLRASAPRIVGTRKSVPVATIASIRRDPGVLGLATSGAIDEEEERGDLFAYGNDDYEVPGAYQREEVPEHPVRIDELPSPVRDAVESLRMPIRFAETEQLQLADFLRDDQASTWGSQPLRGLSDEEREAEARAEAERRLRRPTSNEPFSPSALVGALALVAILALVLWLVLR